MSLADQISDLESDLATAHSDLRSAENEIDELRSYVCDLEHDLEKADAFINYIDKAHPELRTAFEATKKLEGEKA